MITTATQESQKIEACVTDIRWQDPNGSLRCIVIAVGERNRSFSVLGDIEKPTVGQTYEFEGAMSFNEQFSTHQMQLHTYRTVLPSDTRGIERYLVHVAKWVKTPTARKLTKAFGTETLTIIKTDPEQVAAQIKGITLERAQEMQKSLLRNERRERLAVEVHQLVGSTLTMAMIRRAIGKWGSETPAKIRRNPFILTELVGVSFSMADALRLSLGQPGKTLKRHVAALVHVLQEAHRNGHTSVDEFTIQDRMRAVVGEPLPRTIRAARTTKQIRPNGYQAWATTEIAEAEAYVAHKVQSLLKSNDAEKSIHVKTTDLASDQIEAARIFEQSRVMILTGSPGTGKTYLTARLIQALGNRNVALCAPTGKAAKQMGNALANTCGGQAQTIHKLLGPLPDYETGEFRFKFKPDNELSVQAIAIDEFSMVDVKLAEAVLGATQNGTRVLIVGDKHQLPSVGPGSVLRDLIAAGTPSFELTEIKRNTGRIVQACHAIKDGRSPEPAEELNLDTGDNWVHIEAETPEDVQAFIESMYREDLPEFGFRDLTWDVQTIAPMNDRGSLSCKGHNSLLQSILNPYRFPERKLDFSVGDKVLRTCNGEVEGRILRGDKDKNDSESKTVMIVNGDLGIVREITKKHVVVDFMHPRRRAKLPRTSHSLKLAYAVTCHKMQGSEADVIILPIHSQFAGSPLWAREWIYTAFGRAKVALFTIGQLAALEPGIRRIGNTQRRTNLQRLLGGKNTPRIVRY